MAVVYHWKHGWIPLDHEAAIQKAKGNRSLATKMIEAAHGSATGIRSREAVAKAALDLPNVPTSHRMEAWSQLRAAADRHNSADLLPRRGAIAEQHEAELEVRETMANISDQNLIRNVERYRSHPQARKSPTLRVLESEARKRGILHLAR